MRSSQVLVTSESGDVLVKKKNIVFKKIQPEGFVVSIDLQNKRQVIDGIGSSLTESSAFVLASISPEKRKAVLKELFGKSGANFPITRTHMGACDFSVEGKYSYDEVEGDSTLSHFTLAQDLIGFPRTNYPGIIDTSYDLLPLIKEVAGIKTGQSDHEFRIVASPWTAPAWMKDNNAYYLPGQGGGSLKPECYDLFAEYFIRYLEEMRKEGIEIWGITPVNEPEGNNGSWESMHFSPESEAEFVGRHLGPAVSQSEFKHVKIFGYDQNRPEMPPWAEALLGNETSAHYLSGLAIHWYASTFEVFEEILEQVHEKYPEHTILHTEGCIDNLGVPAGDWARDPDGWQEQGWFGNDKWWWHKNASDWGYEVPWGNELHELYAPVHRYARNIIVSINNWMTGFIDWNVVLDKDGGPNHAGNFCGAPVMIDTENEDIYFTPVYHVLKHFSRTIRPGDVALRAAPVEGEYKDSLYVGATLNQKNEVVVSMLNVTQQPISFTIQLGDYAANVSAPGNAIQTITVPLHH